MARKRVAVLISGRGSNMASLIEAAKAPDYPAEIALVISNRPDAAGLARAQAAGVATLVIDHRPHGKDRAAFERVLQHALNEHHVDLVCLVEQAGRHADAGEFIDRGRRGAAGEDADHSGAHATLRAHAIVSAAVQKTGSPRIRAAATSRSAPLDGSGSRRIASIRRSMARSSAIHSS